jgi:hypothetical protein
MTMRPVDGDKMRRLEALAREVGHLIGDAIEVGGVRQGFALMLFSFEGPEFTWVSNAQRADMLKVLEEFVQRQRAGEGGQLWAERS